MAADMERVTSPIILLNDHSTGNWINSSTARTPSPTLGRHSPAMENGLSHDHLIHPSLDSFESPAQARNNNVGFYVCSPQRQLSSSSLDMLSQSENPIEPTLMTSAGVARNMNANTVKEQDAIDTSIAAPYEFAQAPIEKKEENRVIQHQLSQA